eukprot:9155588-Pyramimonas_sp.AAC.1
MAHPVGRTREGEPLKGSRDRHTAAGCELHCGGPIQVRDKSWPKTRGRRHHSPELTERLRPFYSARLA